MSLPKLVPVTRREPPAGYRAPDYRSIESTLLPEERLMEVSDERESLAEAKRAAAKAISGYRWWKPSALLARFRLWLQTWGQK